MNNWKEKVLFWWQTRHIPSTCDNSKTIYKEDGNVILTILHRSHRDFMKCLKQNIESGKQTMKEIIIAFSTPTSMADVEQQTNYTPHWKENYP